MQEPDQLPNSCPDQTDIRQNDPSLSRREFESCAVTGVLLTSDQAAHYLLGSYYSVEVASVAQQNPKVSHNNTNNTITSMEDQTILESQTNKILSQDHLNNFRDLFKLGCGMIHASKTMIKYMIGQILEVSLQVRQIHL